MMAPSDTTAPPHATVNMDMEIPVKSSAPPPKYNATNYTGTDGHGVKNHGVAAETALRASQCAAALAAVIVMVTCKQTKLIPISPLMAIPLDANFNQSPAYIYFVAALSVACLHGIITGALSYLALKKSGGSSEKLQFQLVILDSLLLGIVASAAGAAAAMAYVGLKGNSHSRWKEICNAYGSFCHHIGVSVFMSLLSAVALLLLVWLSFYRLSKKTASR